MVAIEAFLLQKAANSVTSPSNLKELCRNLTNLLQDRQAQRNLQQTWMSSATSAAGSAKLSKSTATLKEFWGTPRKSVARSENQRNLQRLWRNSANFAAKINGICSNFEGIVQKSAKSATSAWILQTMLQNQQKVIEICSFGERVVRDARRC